MINGELVRSRRADLRLSQRALARHVGVSGSVIRNIEEGTRQGTITLQVLGRLASTLALAPGDLLAQGARPALGSFEAQVVALLAQVGEPVPVDAFAAALNVPLTEVEDLLGRLPRLLEPLGLAVARIDDSVELAASVRVNPDQLRDTLRATRGRSGLKTLEARLLRHAIRDGGLDDSRLGNAESVAAGVLRNAGLLTADGAASKAVLGSIGRVGPPNKCSEATV